MIIRNKNFDFKNRTYVMGIINVTPDSFSDGGKSYSLEAVIDNAEKMIKDGVDILDIGGESTRPGAEPVSEEEELKRIIPAVFALSNMFDVPISIDSYKWTVAQKALEAGADMINDVYGLRDFKGEKNRMAEIAAKYDCPVCIMQGCDLFDEAGEKSSPENVINDIRNGFEESLKIASEAGINEEKIILDPGVGFGKSYEANLKVLSNLEKVKYRDFPMLLGASRKSVIGITLGLPAGERTEGTLASTAAAVNAGYGIVRVHDVKENVRFIKMYETILKNRE